MKKDLRTPDFIGIGVEKGGTTWLSNCLREHPEICFAKNKEIYFFNDVDSHFLKYTSTKYQRGIEWYKSQYEHCGKNKVKGEWSTTYICTEETARRIHEHFPHIKLIVCLRNPVKRAFSQYLYEIRLGFIDKNTSFEKALVQRPDYIEKGYYAKQLQGYLTYFKKNQLFILIYEEVKADPEKYIREVFAFLGLKNTSYIPPSLHKNVNSGGTALFPKLNFLMISFEYFMRSHGFDVVLRLLEATGIRNFALKLRDLNNKSFDQYPEMEEKTFRKLTSLYKSDTTKLEKIVEKKLTIWRRKS